MKTDVIVIGSGLGGLECARLLSDQGLSVVVLERERQAGGCMQSFQRGAYHFDTGLHYIGGLDEGQPLDAPMRVFGLHDLPWQRLDRDGFDRVTIAGRTFCLAEGFDRFVDTLAKDFPTERQALWHYIDALKASDDEQWESLRPDAKLSLLASPGFTTGAWNWFHENFSDELLIQVLSGNALRMELKKETLPLGCFAHSNSSFVQSSWRLRGDGNVLTGALIRGIEANGGRIVCNAEVEELIERDGRIAAVRTKDGTEYEATTFVSDVHPAVTFSWLKHSKIVRPIFRHRMGWVDNTFGMLTVQLVLKLGSLPYFNHNHFVYSRPDVWDFYEKRGDVGGVLISCRAPEDMAPQADGSAPEARQIDIMTPLPWPQVEEWSDTTVGRRGPVYEAFKKRKAAECIALAEQVLPGLHTMIAQQYISTPLTYRDYTLTPQGSAYGIRKDYRHTLFTMLTPRTPLPNLLLTGQNLLLHGVHGTTMTALQTCGEIVGRDTVWQELSKYGAPQRNHKNKA